MSVELGILVAILVLVGNAFFVGAEFALVSARRSNIELKALEGSRLAKLTLAGMEQVSLMLAGAQLGITLCSLVFGAVGEPLVAHALEGPFQSLGVPEGLVHPVSFVIALTLMVYLHVVIGEMVPKNLALAKSTSAAMILVPILWYLVWLSRPVVLALNAIANGFIRLVGIKPRQEIRSSFSRDEVAGFIKESHREGLLSEEEEQLLSGALNFEQRMISHVILPLDKVVSTTDEPTPAEIERLSGVTGYSRFPVPDGQGGLRGYVHLKDLLHVSASKLEDKLDAKLVRSLGSVKADASLRDALAIMQKTGSHMAQVTADGVVTGVVMLEDVLEELVGPIRDETRKTS